MSNNPELKDKQVDDIDLLDLFNRLGRSLSRGIKALGRGILYVFFFLIRKWFWLGISLAIGIGASYLIKFSTERFYSSDITLRSNTISNVEMINYINKLHTFCSEVNLDELASALSVSRDKVKDIKDIEAFWIIDLGSDEIPDYVDFRGNHNVLDTINIRMQDRFLIRVKTTVPQELSAIRDGIISFVEKNQFFQEQNDLRLKQADYLLARLNYEVQQLDSLQKVKYFEESRRLMPKDGGQMIFLQEYKTQLLHEDIYRLIRQRQEIEKMQTIYDGLITLISDFTPSSKPDNGALYYGKVVIPLIFVLAIILLLSLDNRKRLVDAYKKY
jgi:hypothetical protein